MRFLVFRSNRHSSEALIDNLGAIAAYLFDCTCYSSVSFNRLSGNECDVTIGGQNVALFDWFLFLGYPVFFDKDHPAYEFIISENNAALDYLLYFFRDKVINYRYAIPEYNLLFHQYEYKFIARSVNAPSLPIAAGPSLAHKAESASEPIQLSLLVSLTDSLSVPFLSVNFGDSCPVGQLVEQLRHFIYLHKLHWLSVDVLLDSDCFTCTIACISIDMPGTISPTAARSFLSKIFGCANA
jgi:hypothetical protein